MASRLFSAKPLSEPMLGYCELDPKAQNSKGTLKYKNIIYENASENIVSEMAVILIRARRNMAP